MLQPVVLVGWTLSLLCLMSLVYGLLHHKLGLATSAAYVSLGHTAWGVALGWIVLACYTGHGGKESTARLPALVEPGRHDIRFYSLCPCFQSKCITQSPLPFQGTSTRCCRSEPCSR